MKEPNNPLRLDVIQNAVNHQVQELEDSAPLPVALETLFDSELNHDLITWPRQYLEAYLDSDESGRVPLTSEQLQDVLEAAFERDEALAVEFLGEMKADRGPKSLPESTLQIAYSNGIDAEYPYELLFDRASADDVRTLSARIQAFGHRGRPSVERRETTSLVVDHRRDSGVIEVHDKVSGTDVRKLLGGSELPQQVQLALHELRPDARIEQALTDGGVYRGTILAETTHDLVQRINQHSAVIHQKDNLETAPRIGDHVRIAYVAGFGRVQQVRERSHSKELAR
jgi:hypothetical protein